MAQMDVSAGDSGHKKGPGVKKAKKQSTRVDMTPMVDLGFLLITFFIYTTTMSTPNTTKLNMPKKTDDKQEMEVDKAGLLTVLLGKDNQIYYYEGELKPDGSNFMTSSYDANAEQGIRKVLQRKKAAVIAAWQPGGIVKENEKDHALTVVIKPSKDANYGRTVDVLDEMTINDVKVYAIVDISPEENTVLELAGQRNK